MVVVEKMQVTIEGGLMEQASGLDFEAASVVVSNALTEDLGGIPGRDVTTVPTIPASQIADAHVVARADGVIAGVDVIGLVFKEVSERLGVDAPVVTPRVQDGTAVSRGDIVADVRGVAHAVLIGERTMLNIICRMSGIATHTAKWVDELRGTGALVLDTRKTTPGLRALEKYAVRCGGGTNKRMGLYDVAMIKDNHKLAAGSITAAYQRVRTAFPDIEIQVEVTTEQEALEAIEAGARFLLCDNFAAPDLAKAVAATRASTTDTVEIEATGGLTLAVAHEYAMTGVDYLSVGGLTHSSPILDLALDIA